jgi:hypothetical protein
MNFESYNFITNSWYCPKDDPIKLVGNISDIIDLSKLIDHLKNINTEPTVVSFDRAPDEMTERIFKIYREVKYPLSIALWKNYYPDIHFDREICNKIVNFLNEKDFVAAWVSQIDPGYTAPWHWDVNSIETDWHKQGTIGRFSAVISDTDPGHASVIGKSIIHMGKPGDMYQWPDHRSWHSGMNSGLTSKYQFNIITVS